MQTYYFKGYLLPDCDELRDVWIKKGHITFEEQKNSKQLFSDQVYISPGLVDSHVHLSMDFNGFQVKNSRELINANRKAHLHSGTLLLRDIGTVSLDTLNLPRDDGLPIVHSAGKFIAPEFGYFDFIDPVRAEDVEQRAVEQVEMGFEWVKIIADFSKEGEFSKMKLNYASEIIIDAVKAVHKAGGRVAIHTLTQEGLELAIESNVDTIEHGFFINHGMIDEMAQKGIVWTPTSSIIRMLGGYPGWGSQIPTIMENMKKQIPYAKEHIQILAGTDMHPHGSIHVELEELINLGLSPSDALASATTIPRKYLNEKGIEEGAHADLIIYTEDPRKNISIISHPNLVLFQGNTIKS